MDAVARRRCKVKNHVCLAGKFAEAVGTVQIAANCIDTQRTGMPRATGIANKRANAISTHQEPCYALADIAEADDENPDW